MPARDQVTVFGFACTQTETLMPLPIWLAHRLARRLSEVRRDGTIPYLLPDGKTQVAVEFRDRDPYRIHSVTILAAQRDAASASAARLKRDIGNSLSPRPLPTSAGARIATRESMSIPMVSSSAEGQRRIPA
jgi:S-adenosylmethionine synthetase